MKAARRLALWAIVLVVGVTASGLAAWWSARRVVRTVVADEIYRSGQPSPSQLTRLRDRGVRTVINLRGENPGEAWYREEVETAQRLGLRLESIRFQGHDAPPRIELLRLVDLLETAERPILIHCWDGLDRTGWASAIVLAMEGRSLDEATRHLSRLGGHFCRRDECHFDRFFAAYRQSLREAGEPHSAERFRAWLRGWVPEPYAADLALIDPAPVAARRGEHVALQARVRNASKTPWLTRETANPVRLGARILGPFDAAPADPLPIFRTPKGPARDLARADLPEPVVHPGASTAASIELAIPHEPGEYVVHLDLVEEHVHWFSDLGNPGVLVRVRVE